MTSLSQRIVARFLEREGYGTPRGWEHRKEREEAVIVNLEPQLQSLWKKLKYQFKGTPGHRLEQFQKYVHEHEGENMRFLQEEADDKLDRMIKEYERRPPPEDYDVPFAG
jgi:hypothetical protein